MWLRKWRLRLLEWGSQRRIAAARVEERMLVLQEIRAVMLSDGDGALVDAGKRAVGALAERLCDCWAMADTKQLFAEWEVPLGKDENGRGRR